MKSFKVRIFYNGYFDLTVDAPSEDHARDIIEDSAMEYAGDASLSYDFAEFEEVQS